MGSYTFGTQIAGAAPAINNDMFKGLATGTDARTRIGNKLKPRYLKGLLHSQQQQWMQM